MKSPALLFPCGSRRSLRVLSTYLPSPHQLSADNKSLLESHSSAPAAQHKLPHKDSSLIVSPPDGQCRDTPCSTPASCRENAIRSARHWGQSADFVLAD